MEVGLNYYDGDSESNEDFLSDEEEARYNIVLMPSDSSGDELSNTETESEVIGIVLFDKLIRYESVV